MVKKNYLFYLTPQNSQVITRITMTKVIFNNDLRKFVKNKW